MIKGFTKAESATGPPRLRSVVTRGLWLTRNIPRHERRNVMIDGLSPVISLSDKKVCLAPYSLVAAE